MLALCKFTIVAIMLVIGMPALGAPGDQYRPEQQAVYALGSPPRCGVGISIRWSKNGELLVEEVIAGSSAARAGLKSGDQIVEVNGKAVKGLRIEEIIDKLRGACDTEVAIQVISGHTRSQANLKREALPTDQLVKEAFARAEKLGTMDLRMLNDLEGFALYYLLIEHDANKGISLFQQLVSLCERAFGASDRRVLIVRGSLCSLCFAYQRYHEADREYDKIMSETNNVRCTNLAELIYILGNVASRYGGDKEQKLDERILEMTERCLGKDDPAVAESLDRLASTYHRQGDYEKARELDERALAIDEKALGPASRSAIASRRSLIGAYGLNGEDAKEEELYKKQLAIIEEAYGPYDRDLALTVDHLSQYYAEKGRYAEAESFCQRELKILEKKPEYWTSANVLERYASLLCKMGRMDEAQKLESQAKEIRSELRKKSPS